MFSALRPGNTLYILDKSEEPVLRIGSVENVSAPRAMYPTYNPAVSFGTNMQTVVDIKVKIGDEKKDIVGVPSNSNIHSHGDFVISETREAMIAEVDAMFQDSKNTINSIPKHEKIMRACEDILKELNPVYAKEQERDDTLKDLKEQVDDIKKVLSRFESVLIRQGNYENN